MSKNENRRIELLNIVYNDKNKISVGKVCDLFCGVISNLDKKTKTFKDIKEKLGEDDYIRLINGLSNSFISTLYINGAKNSKEQAERLNLVSDVNSDITTYKEILK